VRPDFFKRCSCCDASNLYGDEGYSSSLSFHVDKKTGDIICSACIGEINLALADYIVDYEFGESLPKGQIIDLKKRMVENEA
jgi:hypothetical protein